MIVQATQLRAAHRPSAPAKSPIAKSCPTAHHDRWDNLFGQRHLGRLLRYALAYKPLVAMTILMGIAGFLLAFVYPWLIGSAIDTVIAPRNPAPFEQRKHWLFCLAAMGAAAAAAHSIVAYTRGHCTVKLGHRIAHSLRRELFDHFQRLSLHFYSKQRTGSIVNRLIHDVHSATSIIYGGIIVVGLDILQLGIAIVLLFLISWKLTLACLIVLPLYALTFKAFNPKVRKASENVARHIGQISGNIQERLAGIALVKTYAAEERELDRWNRDNEDHYSRVIKQSSISHMIAAVSEFLVHCGTTIVIGYGGYLAMKGDLTAGGLTKFLGYLGIMYGPVRRFADLNLVYQTSLAAMDRVFRVFDITPKIREKQNSVTAPPKSGTVRFDSVKFRYADDSEESRIRLDDDDAQPIRATQRWILSHLNVEVAAGEKIALVGPSGAGKTTLVSLLPRLYDVTEGAIRIDDIDIRDYKLKALRQSIAIVQQDSFVFSGTIKENIAYGKPCATKKEIHSAARASNAHDFITALPDGYDTLLGERGVNLSGGQRQRLSIARAILKNPRILILDEATSALDSDSERLVQEALSNLMIGRTCFIIAHRLSTVRDADRILVLKDGQIIESGAHESLLDQDGLYAKLVRQQFGESREPALV